MRFSLMSNYYDKILLILGLISLTMSAVVATIFISAADVESSAALIGKSLQGENFKQIPIPQIQPNVASWPEAPKQSTGWVYDVFTPPQIFLDDEGNFTIKPPYEDAAIVQPFGLYLAKLERPLYRIQMDGYIEEDYNDASKTLLLFHDIESGGSVRARIGATVDSSAFKVVSFDVSREFGEDGSLTKTAIVQIMDLRTGDTKTLTPGEALYAEGIDIELRSREDQTVQVFPTFEGQEFSTSLGEYKVEAINLDARTITVKKIPTGDEDEYRVETLLLENSFESIETITNPNTAPATITDSFESFFK